MLRKVATTPGHPSMQQILAVSETSTHERQPLAWPPLAQLIRLTNTVADNRTAEPVRYAAGVA